MKIKKSQLFYEDLEEGLGKKDMSQIWMLKALLFAEY